MTVTSTSRSSFSRSMQNKSIDVQTAKQQSADLGRAAEKADLNGDGAVKGTREMDRLFQQADNFDTNGTRRSVTQTKDGETTRAGQMLDDAARVATPALSSGLSNAPAAGTAPTMRLNSRGEHVRNMQEQLNGMGYNLGVDGHMGRNTMNAVRDFQARAGLGVDGIAGPNTQRAMQEVAAGTRELGPARTTGTQTSSRPGAPANRSASFETVHNRGARSQRVDGRITINGNTYDFRSGGGGRGNLPAGEYNVTRHLDYRRDKPTMQVGGEGYSFALSDKYDPRVGDTRSLLRIHPDGMGPGTIGCIGIVGNASVQRQFRQDMLEELRRAGGSFTLRVGM